MKGFIIFFVYIVLTLVILSSLGPTTKAGMGCYAAFSTVYVGILAIMIGCKEEDNEDKEFAICLAIAISLWLISIVSFHLFGI